MTLLELKKSIHEKIELINDKPYLEMLNNILTLHQKRIFIIPEHMKEGIRRGQEDIKNGDFLTLEQLEKRYEKWLKN